MYFNTILSYALMNLNTPANKLIMELLLVVLYLAMMMTSIMPTSSFLSRFHRLRSK